VDGELKQNTGFAKYKTKLTIQSSHKARQTHTVSCLLMRMSWAHSPKRILELYCSRSNNYS